MGDTLVYTGAPLSQPRSQDLVFGSAFSQPPFPAAFAIASTAGFSTATMSDSQQPQQSPVRERRTTEFAPSGHRFADMSQLGTDSGPQKPRLKLRRLPRATGLEGVRTLLVFAKDLVDVRLIDSSPSEKGFTTAMATFTSLAGANEVKDLLDGKMNSSQDAQIIVELADASPTDATAGRFGSRRSTIDGTVARSGGTSSASSGNDQPLRHPSRFSSTFQAIDKIPPVAEATSQVNGANPESSTRLQSLFSPQSPVGNNAGIRRPNMGKSVINDDAVDDETDGLLRDPLAYARNGRQNNPSRPSGQNISSQFGNLSLSTNGYDSGGPLSGTSPTITSPAGGQSQHTGYQQKQGQHNAYGGAAPPTGPGRTSYPPANPADQNPPCNTLYVGNLPNNTSEDELKRIFSQQRGYKRLCFRTKQNGPMCFVEFENVTLATQALHHLYGTMLSNSVKGGIRLSFSKNPLGVRSGQSGIPPSAMSPHGGFSGYGNGNGITPPPGFAPPSGPPPGLAGGQRGHGYGRPPPPEAMNPMFRAHQYSMSGAPFASQLQMPPSNFYANGTPSPGPGHYGSGYHDSVTH